MTTKAFHAFMQKIHYFDDDIDLIDILVLSVENGDLTDTSSLFVLKNLNPAKHIHLSRRKNSNGSRKLIIHHLKQTLYSSYIKDLYEEFTLYLKSLIKYSLKNTTNHLRIIGEHKILINANDLIILGSWEKVCEMIADNVIQELEKERSTIKLLKKIKTKLGLDVEEKKMTDVLPYLELRHFLVHSDGKTTPQFKSDYPFIKMSKGHFVRLDISIVKNMRNGIVELAQQYDLSCIKNNLVSHEDLHGH